MRCNEAMLESKTQTPNYIRNLLIPHAKAATSRRVWSIDLESVWLPFFTATNSQNETAIPHEALGSPLRLALAKDGSIRFRDNGTPVIRVVKDISLAVQLVRENFVAGLMSYTNGIATENPDSFKAEITRNIEAGKPLIAHDNAMLRAYSMAKAEAEAVKPKAERKPAKPKARKVKATPAPATEPPTNGGTPTPESELIAVS